MHLKNIPLEFTYKGKRYCGQLSAVQGAAENEVYHLTVNDYYKGRLRISAFDNTWLFDGEYAGLAEGFGMWVLLIKWLKVELAEKKGRNLAKSAILSMIRFPPPPPNGTMVPFFFVLRSEAIYFKYA